MSILQAWTCVATNNGRQTPQIFSLHVNDACHSMTGSPPWPSGEGVGRLIRRLWALVKSIKMTNDLTQQFYLDLQIPLDTQHACIALADKNRSWVDFVKADSTRGFGQQTPGLAVTLSALTACTDRSLPSTDNTSAWPPHGIGNAERQANMCMSGLRIFSTFRHKWLSELSWVEREAVNLKI